MLTLRRLKTMLWARPRLVLSVLIGIAVALALPPGWELRQITRALIGWNAGAWLYLVLGMLMMFRSSVEQMQRRARDQDEGQLAILAMVVLAAVASLSAIVAELATVKDMQGSDKLAHITLAALTLLSSWAFTHMMFAVHYAHDYYGTLTRGLSGGLDFPGDEAPDYGDFMYLAFVIGTSGQTADVAFTSRSMRRVGLLHCVLAFIFNTTVLALTINIAASLI